MGEPNIFVYVALVAFVAGTAWCFSSIDPSRAALASLLGGWMFTPVFDGRVSVGVLHAKSAFVPAVVLAASALLDSARWTRLRPRLVDLPVALLCFGPFVSSLNADLGLNEALASTLEASLTWGGPYLIGRLYLADGRGPRLLAIAYVTAALVYAPLCWWEIRMSPNLNYDIYGFRLSMFRDSMRAAGYRPSVFFQHALAVALFMATASITAFWLWRTRAAADSLPVPAGWAAAILAVTTVLCKSTGSSVLMLAGMAMLEATRRWRTRALVVALALIPPAVCTVRIAGWQGDTLVEYSRRAFGEERAQSLGFRLQNENVLIPRAMLRPWFGWGRTGGSFVFDPETHQQLSVVDSMWIIVLGFWGIVGLAALYTAILLPPLQLVRACPARLWGDRRFAPAAALSTVLLVWGIDDLNNSMMSPAYPLIIAALVGLLGAARAGARPRAATPSRRRGYGDDAAAAPAP